MATIVTRSGKGSALTFVEADANFQNLENDKIEYTDISVGAEAAASGDGGIAYNNGTGVLTYTPPTPAGIGAATAAQGALADGALQNVSGDSSPSLAGDLDATNYVIKNTITNGDLNLGANGTGRVKITTGAGIDLRVGNITNGATDGDVEIATSGDGMINLNGPVHIQDLTSFAETIEVLGGVSGTLSINAALGPIKYVVPSGAMTINGLATPISGQTVTLLVDNATNSSNFGITLGAGLFTPGGNGVTVTNSGQDLVTITCIDADNGVYVVTAINDFQ